MLRTNLKPLGIGAAVGLVAGVLLGMLLFWVVWPVQYTDAHSYDLSPEGKADYVALVALSYKLDRDYERAAAQLDQWKADETQQAFADAIANFEQQGQPEYAQAARDLAMVLGVSEQPPAEAAPPPPGLLDTLRIPCLVFLIVLLALVLAWIGVRLLLKGRAPGAQPATKRARFGRVVPKAGEPEGPGEVAVLGRHYATYTQGEDAYDESYPIETPDGEYLGECGVGISETLVPGQPGKVTAFEVWLFDKSDIRTVTKVLMSEYAYQDEALRSRLAAKGEAMQAMVGIPFYLETTGLRARALVNELEYSPIEPQPNSVFSKLTVELVVTSRETTGEPDEA